MSFAYSVVEHYHRQASFDFFKTYAYPFYALTFDLDVTRVRAFAKDQGYSTYFNLCYLMTRAMQGIEDFRHRLIDDQLVLYERLHFRAIIPAEGGPFAFGRFLYDDDIHRANQAGRQEIERARAQVALAEEPRHTNFVFYSALPEVPFTGLTHVPSDRSTDAQPKVTFGKFRREGFRLIAPVGLQVNHIFIDGAALGQLYEHARKEMASPGDLPSP
jgi:chloramphenicol O-acetyltransferase type A